MKSNCEIQPIHDLAVIASILLNTAHPQAVDAAMPILATIKAQFHVEAAVEAQDGERMCGQVEAKSDPIADAVEKLRVARAELSQAQRDKDALESKSWETEENLGGAQNKADRALRDLTVAIEDANHA